MVYPRVAVVVEEFTKLRIFEVVASLRLSKGLLRPLRAFGALDLEDYDPKEPEP